MSAAHDAADAEEVPVAKGECNCGAVSQTPGTVYGAAQYLAMRRSYDFGNNWTAVSPPEAADDFTPFVAPYVLCPGQPSVLYAGRSHVYRSDNAGTSWTATNADVPLNAGNPVISLAVARTTPDVAYAGTAPIASRARLFRTRNGGASWTDITGTLPDRYPSDIAVDPNDPNRVYVTFMGFGTSHLFRSGNGGDTWTNLWVGLPDTPASAIAVDPDFPDRVLGLAHSSFAGKFWNLISGG